LQSLLVRGPAPLSEGTAIVFRANLFLGDKRAGTVTFRSLLVTDPSHYVCEPADVLSFDQVVQLSQQMRHLPAVPGGAIGRYQWREECTD
jgi:hypothetical protein